MTLESSRKDVFTPAMPIAIPHEYEIMPRYQRNMRPTDMEADKRCPFCSSTDVRLREGMLRLRTVPVVGGGPWEDRASLVFKCLACGRGFDETEMVAQEGTESEQDGRP